MQIIFYATLGLHLPPEMFGGANTGCRKTLKIYRDNGFDVICIEKSKLYNSKLSYLIRTSYTILQLMFASLFHPKAIVHIVGFYDKVMLIEWLIVLLLKMMNRKVIYEMRNGNMNDVFWNRNNIYRHLQCDVWKLSDGLLCQGQKYRDLIKQETKKDSFLYPNFIKNEFVKLVKFVRPINDSLNLVFNGRIAPSKNIDVIIMITSIVYKKYPQTKLDLIGGYSDEYYEQLKKLITDLKLPDWVVTFHGLQKFDYISEKLYESHFFLFPSTTPEEGHSNSLTEAMGCGVVPIVSPQGFNESVCGDPELVVSELNPQKYAAVIFEILQNNQFEEKSKKVYNRVVSNFTEDIVGHKLIKYIVNL